jgi:hypothetical protein
MRQAASHRRYCWRSLSERPIFSDCVARHVLTAVDILLLLSDFCGLYILISYVIKENSQNYFSYDYNIIVLSLLLLLLLLLVIVVVVVVVVLIVLIQ